MRTKEEAECLAKNLLSLGIIDSFEPHRYFNETNYFLCKVSVRFRDTSKELAKFVKNKQSIRLFDYKKFLLIYYKDIEEEKMQNRIIKELSEILEKEE